MGQSQNPDNPQNLISPDYCVVFYIQTTGNFNIALTWWMIIFSVLQ